MNQKDKIIISIILKELPKLKIGEDIRFNYGKKRFRLRRIKTNINQKFAY